MQTFEISLPDALANFAVEQASVQGHTNVEQFLVSLICQAQQEELEAKLLVGVEALDRGEGRPMTAADWQQLRGHVTQKHVVQGE